MTKKQNRREQVRKLRRVLNRSKDSIKTLGMSIHNHGYRSGIATRGLSKDTNE